jgi:hypothetical protein
MILLSHLFVVVVLVVVVVAFVVVVVVWRDLLKVSSHLFGPTEFQKI